MTKHSCGGYATGRHSCPTKAVPYERALKVGGVPMDPKTHVPIGQIASTSDTKIGEVPK